MATLRSNISTAMYNIRQFRGLNEAESGDTALRDGEASKMRNFRITDSGALTPRGTLQKFVQLGNAYDKLGRYDISLEKDDIILIQDRWDSAETALQLYSTYTYENGRIDVSGEPIAALYSGTGAINIPSSDLNNNAYCKIGEDVYLYGGTVGSQSYVILNKMYPTGKVQALWSGYIGDNRRSFFAVANHRLWLLAWFTDLETYASVDIPGAYIEGDAHLFGFAGKLYILTGNDYLCWDGEEVKSVEGYIPCVLTACAPANGSGTTYERINNLTLKRKCRYNADGEATVYKILEQGVTILEVRVNGELQTEGTDYTKTTSEVTFTTAPAAGTENVEIIYQIDGEETTTKEFTAKGINGEAFKFAEADYGMELAEIKVFKYTTGEQGYYEEVSPANYTVINNSVVQLWDNANYGQKVKIEYRFKTPREKVLAMKYSEFFNGTNENRVFLYGDGTNKVIYSGLDENGQPTAEYFPDLNECRIGVDTSPVTALVKHYNRLLAFKDNEAYSIYYDILSLADGSATAGFYVSAINKSIGCCAEAQAVLVENRVRTLDGADIYEWRATSSAGNITLDQRNASRISQRVQDTLSTFDLRNGILYYDKARHEFYCISGDKALVQNVEADAWYAYTDFPVTCMLAFEDRLVCGLADGHIAILDRDAEINFKTEWVSGSLDFNKPYAFKNSTQIWVQIKPERSRKLNISIETESGLKLEGRASTSPAGAISPTLTVKMKPRKFIRYKLGIEALNRLTLLGANINVSYSTNIK